MDIVIGVHTVRNPHGKPLAKYKNKQRKNAIHVKVLKLVVGVTLLWDDFNLDQMMLL